MNVREAILRAADSIEERPELFRFSSTRTPDCGTPGCALGWISAHLGGTAGESWGMHDELFEAMGIAFEQHGRFYDRMNAIATGWAWDADRCASALRQYADKYHPAQSKHTGIPDSVRAIFQQEQAA